MHTYTLSLPYKSALSYYKILKGHTAHSFLFESSDTASKASRLSMLGIDPALELRGKDGECRVNLLQERGRIFFDFLAARFAPHIASSSPTTLLLHLPKEPFSGPERERFQRQNPAQAIRELLLQFKQEGGEENYMGLYGALSYYFVYQYEELERTKPEETPDFHLFLFDTILFFNHLTHQCSIYSNRQTMLDAQADALRLKELILNGKEADMERPKVSKIEASPSDETFKEQIERARYLCERGEIMELVLARKITANITGDPIFLYEHYKNLNPSPYMFYFNFGEEVLLGASPEMMIRYEGGKITLRPISGSAPRGKSAIEDHFIMMELLNSGKEKSELDMLIDLGRNDLARVCKPGVQVEHYRVVEKYSHVMHTVAQVAGELEDGMNGLDGLVACLNAGTLTGAPKVAAMRFIEEIEQHSRGYYGGAVGYFLFSGEVNTSIIIRSSYIHKGLLRYLTGATLLYESDADMELAETKFKAAAFMEILKKFSE